MHWKSFSSFFYSKNGCFKHATTLLTLSCLTLLLFLFIAYSLYLYTLYLYLYILFMYMHAYTIEYYVCKLGCELHHTSYPLYTSKRYTEMFLHSAQFPFKLHFLFQYYSENGEEKILLASVWNDDDNNNSSNSSVSLGKPLAKAFLFNEKESNRQSDREPNISWLVFLFYEKYSVFRVERCIFHSVHFILLSFFFNSTKILCSCFLNGWIYVCTFFFIFFS